MREVLLGGGAGTVLAVFVGLAVLWFAWRWSLLSAQSKALNAQAEVINAYESRIKQLEDTAKQDRVEREEMRAEIAELRGEVEGQRDLAKAIVEVVGESKICLISEACANRVLPTV